MAVPSAALQGSGQGCGPRLGAARGSSRDPASGHACVCRDAVHTSRGDCSFCAFCSHLLPRRKWGECGGSDVSVQCERAWGACRTVCTRARSGGLPQSPQRCSPPPAGLGRTLPTSAAGRGRRCVLVLTPWPPRRLTTGGRPPLLAPHPQGPLALDRPPGDPHPLIRGPSAGLASSWEDHTEPRGAWPSARWSLCGKGRLVAVPGPAPPSDEVSSGLLPTRSCHRPCLDGETRSVRVSRGRVGLGDRPSLLQRLQSPVTLVRGSLRKGGWGPL